MCTEAAVDEIEVTPEMIEAGLALIYTFHHERSDHEAVAAKIYRAMASLDPKRVSCRP